MPIDESPAHQHSSSPEDAWGGGYGGLRDLFPAFYAPSLDEQREVITKGLVCIDTNVLLDLYRYRPAARSELLAVLHLLGARLFVPHQVALEFQTGRIGAVTGHLAEYDQQISTLNSAREQAISAINFLAKRRSLPTVELGPEVLQLESSFDVAIQRLRSMADEYDLHPADLAVSDPIRNELDRLLSNRVGKPLAPTELKQARATFASTDRPTLPGDGDAKRKPINLAVGDYLLWIQLKAEAKERAIPVLFVTSDDKKDWVFKDGGRTERPRRELVEEVLEECGVRLHMLQTGRFLQLAREHLDAAVSQETVEEVSVTRTSRRYDPPPPVRVLGEEQPAWISVARCCTPVPPDPITAFSIRGGGIRVHRQSCPNVKDDEHSHEVEWTSETRAPLELSLIVLVEDPTIFVEHLSSTLLALEAELVDMTIKRTRANTASIVNVRLRVARSVDLQSVQNSLHSMPSVLQVSRDYASPSDDEALSDD